MTEVVREDRELRALISLLETEDTSHVAILLEQIRGFPPWRLQHLTDLLPPNSLASAHVNLVLAEQEAPRLQAAFLRWAARGADLEEGALLVARVGYPRLDEEAVRAQIDDLAAEIRPGLPPQGIEAVRYLGQVLGEHRGFHGNLANYDDPDNSYINRVLERRTGLPIALSVLYILLGKRLGLAVSGVALPNHFITSLATPTSTFFFDPFHGGKILSLRDVMAIVTHAGDVFHPRHLRSAGSRQIIHRMLANLLRAYRVNEEVERAELARQYLSVL